MRQPEVERELSALRQGADKDQAEGWEVERMRADHSAGCKNSVEIIAARHVPEHQHAGKQAETAGGCHYERHARAIPRLRSVVPIADEEERQEARQFPEEYQLDQVSREHDAEHGASECEQKREESWHGIGR